MRAIFRQFGFGTLYHTLWRRPRTALKEMIAAGGPLEIRRTERGRVEMETAAWQLPGLPRAAGTPLTLHLLTGRRFWYQTAFCLWSFARHAQRPLAPVIYDDGSLAPEFREPLAKLFPAARFVDRLDAEARLDEFLPANKFPHLRERWVNYPNLRKLIDPHLGGSQWQLVIDSDLLFFRRPDVLIDWLDQPTQPLHAVDCETSYGYNRPTMDRLAGAPLSELVNVGLTGLHSSEIDWEKLESWCRVLIESEGHNYYLEQALIAMLLAGRQCTIAPVSDYLTLPLPPESHNCRAVMHHYVWHSKRAYFQHGWRVALER